jgi:mannose/fructose/N-acetylgalactosamine-specific phosphotransferase system component IID
MVTRLFAIQGAWNYETLLGNGIGFCMEPALRLLPGGKKSPEFKAALARESRYFNAHPYFASVAVGALARVELDREPAEKIERFRAALPGPLGSVGDRLIWAGWMPFCSLVALTVFGLGGGPWAVVGTFLILYNVVHVGIRIWGLNTGWNHGLRVASALGHPILRQGPPHVARLAAFAAGIGLPLAIGRVIGSSHRYTGVVVAAAILGGAVVVALQNKIEGWRLTLLVLAIFAVVGMVR